MDREQRGILDEDRDAIWPPGIPQAFPRPPPGRPQADPRSWGLLRATCSTWWTSDQRFSAVARFYAVVKGRILREPRAESGAERRRALMPYLPGSGNTAAATATSMQELKKERSQHGAPCREANSRQFSLTPPISANVVKYLAYCYTLLALFGRFALSILRKKGGAVMRLLCGHFPITVPRGIVRGSC